MLFHISTTNLKKFKTLFVTEPLLQRVSAYQSEGRCGGDYVSFSYSELPNDQINLIFVKLVVHSLSNLIFISS